MRQRYTTNPCDLCRARHKKCDGKRPCSRCIKSNTQCESTNDFRFKVEPSSGRRFNFPPRQKWVGNRKNGQLTYVHTNKSVPLEESLGIDHGKPVVDSQGISASARPERVPDIFEDRSDEISSSTDLREDDPMWATIDYMSCAQSTSPFDPMGLLSGLTPSTSNASLEDEEGQIAELTGSSSQQQELELPEGSFTRPKDFSYSSVEEACLMRHFIDSLASWFDMCDRDRYFEVTVPQRAPFCPALKYAILATSAAHMVQLSSCRGELGSIEFAGIKLPYLSIDTAIRYYHTCIAHLQELRVDARKQRTGDATSTLTIMRFYEQIGAPFTNIEPGSDMSVIQACLYSQHDDSLCACQTTEGLQYDQDTDSVLSTSPLKSMFLITIQQEIWGAFLTQQPFRLPLCLMRKNSELDLTNEFDWTFRILLWTADLLKFHFSQSNLMTPVERVQRWQILKAFDTIWEANKPAGFNPLYFEEAKPSARRFLPVIWYKNTCQVIGAQHIQLSRVLLVASNPNLSRLGITARAASLMLENELCHILRQLVGLALSNPKCPAVSINAAVGISVCGGYLTNPAEQNAILEFLADVEFCHAWPTSVISTTLKETWRNNACHSLM